MANQLFGVMNVDKPSGKSSRWVVDVVQSMAGKSKVGHAGTLDPLATGVLVLCVGAATRLIPYVQRMAKSYRATFLLGRSSSTEDIEGEVRILGNAPQPSRGQLERAIGNFRGEIQQRPPAYSAVKVRGKRAYKLARRGEQFELAPRTVSIYHLEVVRYEYPELTLDVRCGSGTYVRSLGRDLAESLGTASVMSALERTAIGHFRIDEALNLDEVSESNLASFVLPAREAVRDLPALNLTADEQTLIVQGRPIERSDLPVAPTGEYAGLAANHRLLAILTVRESGTLAPTRVFPGS